MGGDEGFFLFDVTLLGLVVLFGLGEVDFLLDEEMGIASAIAADAASAEIENNVGDII